MKCAICAFICIIFISTGIYLQYVETKYDSNSLYTNYVKIILTSISYTNDRYYEESYIYYIEGNEPKLFNCTYSTYKHITSNRVRVCSYDDIITKCEDCKNDIFYDMIGLTVIIFAFIIFCITIVFMIIKYLQKRRRSIIIAC